MHYCIYCIIAIEFLGINYCILQYSIAFLATIAIAIAIVLDVIGNCLAYIYIIHFVPLTFKSYIRNISVPVGNFLSDTKHSKLNHSKCIMINIPRSKSFALNESATYLNKYTTYLYVVPNWVFFKIDPSFSSFII